MARNVAAALALGAVAAGFFLIHPGLGLVVPGAFVLAALVWSHLRAEGDDVS